ncbi:MAG TPA: ABC transporter permease [Gemmatimonadales bacterium]|jgi:putative ABC transport system permease protein
MDALLQDLRYAVRSLSQNLGFTLAAVLTLAIGLGGNTAIFSVVNGVLLRPLPFPRPEQLAIAWGHHPAIGRETVSLPDFLDWQSGVHSFDRLAAVALANYPVNGRGEAELVSGAVVTANFFRTLGVSPAVGRDFLPGEDSRSAPRVAILGYNYWQRHFGGQADAVGRHLDLGAEGPYTIVGVAPRDLRWEGEVDLWTPLAIDSTRPRRSDFLTVVGRLRPGATLLPAQNELNAVARQLEERYPDTNTGWRVDLVPLQEELVGNIRPALLMFMGAVVLVLLIACLNVANLMLARLTSRHREIAVRTALGASRSRLLRQLLVESTVLALMGGGVGLLLATWGIDALRLSQAGTIPRIESVTLDWRVLAFALGLTLATGLAAGLIPAHRLTRADPQIGLRDGSRAAAGSPAVGGARRGLVVAEVAIAVVLLSGAGLLLRSFARLLQVNPGFRVDNVLTAQISLPRVKYADQSRRVALYEELNSRIAATAGVQAAGLVSRAPLGDGAPHNSFEIEHALVTDPAAVQDAETLVATTGYFTTLNIPLLRGRLFGPEDRAGAPGVALISQTMARRYWKGHDPLGIRITRDDPSDPAARWYTIVGVVGDVRHERLAELPYPQLYLPMAQVAGRRMILTARVAGDPMRVVAVLRRTLAELDSQVPLSNVRTMRDRVAESAARPRASAGLLALFAATALLLALVGVYGVIAYGVTQRTRELGIRVALGARPREILRLVMRQGMAPVVAGISVGVICGLAGSRLLRSMLFQVEPTDLLTYIAVIGSVSAAAMGASYWPARRATRVDPIVALRSE